MSKCQHKESIITEKTVNLPLRIGGKRVKLLKIDSCHVCGEIRAIFDDETNSVWRPKDEKEGKKNG